MAKLEEKITATGFRTSTRLTWDQLLVAADEAAGRAAGVVDRISRVEASATRAIYQVRRAGVRTATCSVSYEGAPPNAVVSFAPGNYLTSQARLLVIPIGPKDSSALRPFQRFSRELQLALTVWEESGA